MPTTEEWGDTLDEIIGQTDPLLTGNFCVIVHNNLDDTIQIKTNRYRGFPVYYNSTEVTNLAILEKTVWTNRLITIDGDFNIIETKFNIFGEFEPGTLTVDQVVEQINTILDQRTQNFLKYNQLPIKVFLTGGVDSLLVYSYLQKFTDNYELVFAQHIDYDRFWLMNHGTITEKWGYTQIHHWRDPCVLTSGAPGDEFMLRGPTTANIFLQSNGLNAVDLLNSDEWNTCLHRSYFLKKENFSIFNQPIKTIHNQQLLHWTLCNNIINDWQHWHIVNTLTYTPLRDLEIFKLILRLPLSEAVNQIMDSGLSKQLIEHNRPGLSQLISSQKNSGNYMSNLCDFYNINQVSKH